MHEEHRHKNRGGEEEPVIRRLLLKRQDMAYVQFILESYEGMVNVTALDSRRGVVSLSIMPGFLAETEIALEALANTIMLKQIEFP
ncbi:MAG: DUF4911 domain-containing protein [Smithellaceae bacterium]|nr:DUF4911 domain-containing protein [Smithellaceae bacterium]